ncbi:hypothetical protein BKA58DRAFT_372699 [Alternaria rosae]|uniref:uncharacterized protein n=1 Tax=Alternaria rosae TaxID=1187941 RepID=UPI001E8E22DF|nr:uncharacterized protein BKA58DRAFT_372699 [Alternaria rosae]KAH6882082.1 hypothetical protein BKA58DRAFT_372699 [Alternaria rosae]
MSTNSFQTHGGNEEKAPLYALSQPIIPEPDAPPADIREFLTGILAVSRRLSHEHASAIANKWKLGTGRELREYPPKMYLEIFGPEEGWCVYREVKTRLLSKKDQGALPRDTRAFLIGASIFFMVSAYYLIPAFCSSSRALPLRAMAFVAFSLFGGGGLICGVAAVQSPRTVDEQVEQDLIEAFVGGDTSSKR